MNLKNGNRQAFTLIEMILAMGVAALVLITVTTVLFTTLHLRNATADAVDAVAPVDQAVAFIQRDLACVVPPTNGTSKVLSGSFRAGTVNSAAEGTPVAIELYTATGALSDNSPWGDLQRVSYGLKNAGSGGGWDLVRSVSRNLLATTATPDVTDQLLLRGVASIRFSCYDGAQWNDSWDTSSENAVNTNLPVAVRVDIQMAGINAGPPIEMVVPIDVQARTNAIITTGS